MGYQNQYIYNYYVQSGIKDSVKIDRGIAPTSVRWIAHSTSPKLILEEGNRIFVLDQFGYVQNELLKPQGANELLGLHNESNDVFTFYDADKGLIYFLNAAGKIIDFTAIDNPESYCVIDSKAYVLHDNNLKILNL